MRTALTLIAAATLAAPATAAAPLMSADLTAAAEARVIVKGAAFACEGETCTTRSAASRPAVLCERLVKEVGPVTSFKVNGEEMDARDLERCNAKAR